MATIQDVFTAMSQMEGWNVSNSLAQKNNNPLNLRYAGQTNGMQGQGGYAAFATPQDGINAGMAQIALDSSRGLTLAQFINKFAPPTENNTGNYITFVSAQTGIAPTDVLANVLGDSVNPYLPHHRKIS